MKSWNFKLGTGLQFLVPVGKYLISFFLVNCQNEEISLKQFNKEPHWWCHEEQGNPRGSTWTIENHTIFCKILDSGGIVKCTFSGNPHLCQTQALKSHFFSILFAKISEFVKKFEKRVCGPPTVAFFGKAVYTLSKKARVMRMINCKW